MWISSEIHYEKVKVRKKTIFGWRTKNGYRLTKDLRWKAKDGVFYILKAGYVWDGASYPKWIQFIAGKRNLPSVMAASAFHDTAHSIPARYTIHNPDGTRAIGHVKFNISDAATLYNHMLEAWANKDETVSNTQSNIQRYTLVILQPIYNLFKTKSGWEIL